jgi:anaphase-promoting complex subunit 5
MSRYLTASKIGLLSLISLYADSVVPADATIPILSFVIRHTLQKGGSLDEQQTWDASPAAGIEQFQDATIGHASAIPGRSLWDLLLKKLWAINSFDALHAFFESLNQLLAKTREEQQREREVKPDRSPIHITLSRTSPVGIFVRRSILEFTRLPLHDGVTLWKTFVVYREPTLSTWKKRNPLAGRDSFDSTLNNDTSSKVARILYGDLSSGIYNGAQSLASADDAERILEFQIDRMQKMGQRLPSEVKTKIEEMLHVGTTMSSLSYYIRFLDAWKGGDYTSAFDNLHRYFDYTMHIQGRTFYQYALVNMAIMQADFGCYTEAVSAMHESIAMARENKDMSCLNFCLSWLYHFNNLHPRKLGEAQRTEALGLDREALVFIKAKAKESGMWSLLSTSLLGEAGLGLANGESIASAFENVVKSAHLNNAKNIAISHGNQIAVESSLYSRLGITYMQWCRYEIFLECHAQKALSEDVMKFTCMHALALSRKGRYEQALATIDGLSADTLRTLRYRQVWMAYAGLLKLHLSLRRGYYSAAQHHLSRLQSFSPRDHTTTFSISLLHVDMLLRLRQFSEALVLVDEMSASMHTTEPDVHAKIKLMVLKVRIFEESGVPQKGFSIALRAASLAYKFRILEALWEAVTALCRVLCSLTEYNAVVQLMRGIMPQVLESEDCELVATAFSCLADAHVGLAGQAAPRSTRRKEQMTKALEYLERAFDDFSRLEDCKKQCEMMAKRATVLLNIGDILAYDHAAKYLAIKKAAEESSRA